MKQSQPEILIIDDNKFIIKLIIEIVRGRGGFFCRSASNYKEIMEEMNKCPPKLIFLDVNLPDLNGYEFCKKLRSDEKFKDVFIYYLTGTPKAEIANKVLETKADGYISKPFNLSDFDDVFDFMSNENINKIQNTN